MCSSDLNDLVVGDDIGGTGQDGDDSVFGNDGNDTLSGQGGNDLLNGQDGNDTIGNDSVEGETGDDSILGGGGDDTITGGDGDDLAIFNVALDGSDRTDLGAGDDNVSITAPDSARAIHTS